MPMPTAISFLSPQSQSQIPFSTSPLTLTHLYFPFPLPPFPAISTLFPTFPVCLNVHAALTQHKAKTEKKKRKKEALSKKNNKQTNMSNKSPIFPMPEPQHFSDYGFDPQIDYFQVLEEARKHKRETTRSIDSIHFKLQKPISKDDLKKTHKVKKKRWWRSAFLFFKWKWTHINHHHHQHSHHGHGHDHDHDHDREDVHQARARAFRASISGPVYITESTSGSSTPYRTSSRSRPSSGPLAGTLTPARKGEVDIPYLSLRELNMEQQQVQQQRFSTSAMPIYLVT